MYNTKEIVLTIEKTTKKNNLTISKLLLNCNLDKSVISRMKSRGQMISADKLAIIADYLNCSTDYLLGRTLNPEINTEPYIEEIPKNVIKIPLENLSVSAGPGQELIDDFNDIENEYIEIDADDFPNVDRAFRVKGDSMEPKYHDNDIVLVKCQPVIENGDIGIFTLNEKGYIKKFNIDSDNNRTLVSLNKNYAPIPLNTNDDVRAVGRVLCTL